VRRDYGAIDPGCTVVDIGANIGAFAIYAAKEGARRVVAYEPNGASFRCLEQNIAVNALQAVVQARQLAVTDQAGHSVQFPSQASMYGRIGDEDDTASFEAVETTSLARIVERDTPGGIDLLKIDCEGAEYDILLGAESALAHVREVRMEYHDGRERELEELFRRCGFDITLWRADSASFGQLWVRRSRPGERA
jgi:FkbM family methyltransferase